MADLGLVESKTSICEEGKNNGRRREGRKEEKAYDSRGEEVVAAALLTTDEEDPLAHNRHGDLPAWDGEGACEDARGHVGLEVALGRGGELENVDGAGGIAEGVGLATCHIDEVGQNGSDGRLDARLGEGERQDGSTRLDLVGVENVDLGREGGNEREREEVKEGKEKEGYLSTRGRSI